MVPGAQSFNGHRSEDTCAGQLTVFVRLVAGCTIIITVNHVFNTLALTCNDHLPLSVKQPSVMATLQGGPWHSQNFSWVGHNAFGPPNNWLYVQ